MAERPTGVTVICVLGFILSILLLLGGIAALGVGAVAGGTLGSTVGALFGVLGVIVLIIGVVGLVAFWLLLKMKKIGWILVTVIGILSIITNLISVINAGAVVGIVLWLIIILYLYKKRALFTK